MRSRIPWLVVVLGALLGLLVACGFGAKGGRQPTSPPSSQSSAPAVLSPTFTASPQPSPTPTKPEVQIRIARTDGSALSTVPDCATLFANEGRDYLLVFYLPSEVGDVFEIEVFDRDQGVASMTLYAGDAMDLPGGWQGMAMALSELYSQFSSPPTPDSELTVLVFWEDGEEHLLCQSHPWTPEPLDLGVSQDLAVADVFLYYDSAAEEGTFAATVCNLGGRTSTPFNLVLEANGVTIQQEVQRAILPWACMDVVADQPFSAFGVQQPGSVQVRAQVAPSATGDPAGNNAFAATLEVTRVSTRPSQEALRSYQTCLQATRNQDFPEGYPVCTYLLQGAPLAERDEVSAQKGNFLVVVPRPFSGSIGTTVSTFALCGEQALNFFPWADTDSEPWMAFGYPASDTSGHHALAGDMYFATSPGDPLFWFSHPLLTQGKCVHPVFSHEFFHLAVQRFIEKSYRDEQGKEYAPGVIFPYTLHEGLATWGAAKLNPQPNDPQCQEKGFMEGGELWPYLQMGKSYEEQLEILKQTMSPEEAETWYSHILYNTGACFWKYIEDKHGVEAISRILEGMANSSQDLCVSFLDTFVAPVIGKEDYPEFEKRFGLTPEVSVCDF